MDVIEGASCRSLMRFMLISWTARGVTPIEQDDKITCDAPCWLHLDYAHPASAEWLSTTPLLPDSVREALSGAHGRASAARVKAP